MEALVALNLLTALIFGWDKWCATRRHRRVPERWLLLMSALGGAPGAWCACLLFRHKTRKRSFQWKLIGATAVSALLIWAAFM